MEKPIVFFSSQSWLPEKSDIIRMALKKAIRLLEKKGIAIDYREASNNQKGSKLLLNVITQLIDSSFMLVGDISNLGWAVKEDNYVTNPNVMFEVGYAIKTLGYDRVFLCYEGDYRIPSDIRGLQIIQCSRDAWEDLAQKIYTAILDLADKHMLYPVSDDDRDRFKYILEYEWNHWVDDETGMYYAIDPFFQVQEKDYQVGASFYMSHYRKCAKQGLLVNFIDKYKTLSALVVDQLDGTYQVPKPEIKADFYGFRPLFYYCKNTLEFAYLANKSAMAIHAGKDTNDGAYRTYKTFLDEMIVFANEEELAGFAQYANENKDKIAVLQKDIAANESPYVNPDFRLNFEDRDPRHNQEALEQAVFQKALKRLHTQYMREKDLYDINETLIVVPQK